LINVFIFIPARLQKNSYNGQVKVYHFAGKAKHVWRTKQSGNRKLLSGNYRSIQKTTTPMGILNDMRKLLFGAKSVTKSASRKAADTGREASEDLKKKADQYMDQARDKADELWEEMEKGGEQVKQESGDFINMAKDKWAELEEEIRQRRRETGTEDTGGTAGEAEEDLFADLDLGQETEPEEGVPSFEEKKRREEAYREFKEKADEVANKFLDVSDQAGRKFMDLSERVGKQLQEKGGKAFEQAKLIGGQLLERANEMAEKAQADSKTDIEEMAEKARKLNDEMEDRIRETKDRFAGKESKNSDSLLDDKDDFFSRAERFAEGDYQNEGARKKEGDMEIGQDPDYKPQKKEGLVPGFEDLDNDGDEIIDDAIIDEDDDKDQ